MLSDDDVKNLIKELEKEMATCQKEDQFGYAEIDAWDVYKKVIKRLKEINKGELLKKKKPLKHMKVTFLRMDKGE